MLCYEYKLHVVNVRSERHFRVQLGTFKLICLCICLDTKESRYDILKKGPVTHKTTEVKFRDSQFRGYDQF